MVLGGLQELPPETERGAVTDTIDRFIGEYRFLSNFYPAEVVLGEEKYKTVEHAYQAAKSVYSECRVAIQKASTPGIARSLGNAVHLRPDWEEIKVYVMLDLLRQKFADPVLGAELLATGDAELVEGNNWGDAFWGAVDGGGKNMLGILLHIVRYELRRVILGGGN